MERTTDLVLLKEGHPFTWGEVIKIHEIGEYAIVEYRRWEADNVRILVGQADTDNVMFSCYIDGNSLSKSTDSLDSALANCIAYKHEGMSSHAEEYFMKMIKEERVETTRD